MNSKKKYLFLFLFLILGLNVHGSSLIVIKLLAYAHHLIQTLVLQFIQLSTSFFLHQDLIIQVSQLLVESVEDVTTTLLDTEASVTTLLSNESLTAATPKQTTINNISFIRFLSEVEVSTIIFDMSFTFIAPIVFAGEELS